MISKLEKAPAFGTNITYPFVCGNGFKGFVKTSFQYTKAFLKGNDAQGWGKSATVRASKSLVPCVHAAIQEGIQIFDCSRAYWGSEQRLARALKDVPRNKVFLITKIDDQSQFTGKVKECFEESLRQLQTDYVDLLLLHWPVDYPKTGNKRLDDSAPVYARSWHELEQIFKSGRVKSIGVANFSIAQLEKLRKYAEIMPMANEFECHPLCIRKELNEYCISNHIQVYAYASLCAMDKRLLNPQMAGIAERHEKTIPQVILKWHIQRGRIPIFGTSKTWRIKEYASLDDFTLTDRELDVIDAQNINYRAFPDSEHCDFTKGIWLGWENYKDCCP